MSKRELQAKTLLPFACGGFGSSVHDFRAKLKQIKQFSHYTNPGWDENDALSFPRPLAERFWEA